MIRFIFAYIDFLRKGPVCGAGARFLLLDWSGK